jgi:2-dehydro-3-deoxyphosphogluconate aldolase/(4S)-4-hydroxy-2-oxoglutarate aldolase
MLAPLPQARLLPTGGVTPQNIAEWFEAGAAAVGIGTALVGPGTRPVDLAALRARTGALIQALAAL